MRETSRALDHNGTVHAGVEQAVRHFCIATNHGHQPGNCSQDPPDYEQSFAHRLIDAGADAYVGHGPHQLRGIEIYKGRPIFYIIDVLRTPVVLTCSRFNTDAEVTVSEMSATYPTDPEFSDPVFYDSIVTVSRFEKNRLIDLQLY